MKTFLQVGVCHVLLYKYCWHNDVFLSFQAIEWLQQLANGAIDTSRDVGRTSEETHHLQDEHDKVEGTAKVVLLQADWCIIESKSQSKMQNIYFFVYFVLRLSFYLE